MSGQNSKPVKVNVTDPGGQIIGTVSNEGVTSLPPSEGVPLTVSKGSARQVTAVHGTVAGIVVDIPNSGQ